MTTHEDQANDPLYWNWVNGGLGLKFLKEGLESFVDDTLKSVHAGFLDDIRNNRPGLQEVKCTECTTANVLPCPIPGMCNIRKRGKISVCSYHDKTDKLKTSRPCPNSICDTIYDKIPNQHRFARPSWKNTNAQNWCSNHFEIGKCFLPKSGYEDKTATSQTDSSGILNMAINCLPVQSRLDAYINPPNDILSKLIQVRNLIFHSASLTNTKEELDSYIDDMVTLLEDKKTLLDSPNAKSAVLKLKQLKNGDFRTTTEVALEIRAIRAVEIKTEEAKRTIKHKTEEGIDIIEQTYEAKRRKLSDQTDSQYGELRSSMKTFQSTSEAIQEIHELKLKTVEKDISDLKEANKASNTSTVGHNNKDKIEYITRKPTIGVTEGNQEEEFKIKTDEDDLFDLVDNDFDLRDYQKELAKEGCKGKNVIIIAPTNSGKTRVAFKIMQMKQKNEIGKVIFIVENEFLANQQGDACAKLLPAYRAKIISGTAQRKKQYLKDFVDKRDILIVTAQILVNALQQSEIKSLTKFTMIVFDECHHTNDEHPYNQIMTRYIDLKLDKDVDDSTLPQIVGLTAALSAGGSMNEKAAINNMKRVMANLDANFICTVRQNKEELKNYENPPFEEIVTCEGRTDDIYKQTVVKIMDSIEQLMLKHPCMENLPKHDQFILNKCKVPGFKGTEQFIQWLADFKKAFVKVKSNEVRRVINPCREALEIYNRSLLLHKDAQVNDAYRLVVNEHQQSGLGANDEVIDADIVKLLEDLNVLDFANIPDNPKLIKMKEILVDKLQDDKNARCLIFVKTRELARALEVWMNETDELQMLHAHVFIGQTASASKGGMTKYTQKSAIDNFKGGRHKVIIATLGEEGLDITKCNLVIRYEHVTNEVVRLQSRGRARAQCSKYLLLTEYGSWKIDKEEKNAQLEILMNKIIPDLQQYLDRYQNDWQAEMIERQTTTKLAAQQKRERREAFRTEQDAELRCFKCRSFICSSSDVKKIHSGHNLIVDKTVKERALVFGNPIPKFAKDEVKPGGDFLCRGDECTSRHSLGTVVRFMCCDFPVVKISQFLIVYQSGNDDNQSKWKNVKFKVEPITLDDLSEIVEKNNT